MEMYRGDDLPIHAVLRGAPDPPANPRGKPFDLTGCALWFTVKTVADATVDDLAALVRLSWNDGGSSYGIDVTDILNGVAEITIPRTANLQPGMTYRYDVQVKNMAGRVRTLEVGELIVKLDVTIRETLP